MVGKVFAAMALMIVAIPLAGATQDVTGRVVRADEAVRWRAVGSLNMGGQRRCTAELISDHEAITAAHCVVNRETGKRVAPRDIQLVLGQTAEGRAAVRGIVATAVLPDYLTGEQKTGLGNLITDIALLDLDMPVTPEEAVPLKVVDWQAPVGELVDIVGYERGGPDGATIREGCTAIDSAEGVTAVTCAVVSGLSGAPVLLQTNPDEPPALVAVVSSRSTGQATALAFVVSVAPHLAELRALIGK